ncbi:MAG: hypothetical protein ACFFD9_01965 [Candidatus Thorarchaeota archaeon]
MQQLTIATIVYPSRSSETNAVLFAESVRSFGGALHQTPIWCFMPCHEEPLSSAARQKLDWLEVTIIPFEHSHEVPKFAFTGHVEAAALAESRARHHSNLLAWLAPNTLVLQEPREFLLQKSKSLGYRPVHHKLLGLRFNEPLDAFWSLIYDYCGVSEDRIFPMRTQIEDIEIRPYFNAGLLILDPNLGILRAWRNTFFRIYQESSFQPIYNQDSRYEIFMSQAVLSGVILSNLAESQMQELSMRYNYPLNLYAQDLTENRPNSLEECPTVRHEGFYLSPEWMKTIPAGELLKQWIAERLL